MSQLDSIIIKRKLLLIDSRLSNVDGIISSMNYETYCLVFNYEYDTQETIFSKLRFLNDRNKYIKDNFYYGEKITTEQEDDSMCPGCEDVDNVNLLGLSEITDDLLFSRYVSESDSQLPIVFFQRDKKINVTYKKYTNQLTIQDIENSSGSVIPSGDYVEETVEVIMSPKKVDVHQLDAIYDIGVNGKEMMPVLETIEFASVGIMQHSYPLLSTFNLLKTDSSSILWDVVTQDETLVTWLPFKNIIRNFKMVYKVEVLDLMACAIYSNPNWKYIIDRLAFEEQIVLRASTDNTGASEKKGNWIMETSDVDLSTIYFTEKILEWKYVLATNSQTFNYTGAVQTFTASVTGTHTFQVWGASGGDDNATSVGKGGRGGYSKGDYYLTKGTTVSVYVGQQGYRLCPSGQTGYWYSTGGGGATDIRPSNDSSYSARIIVAGGGGGRHGASVSSGGTSYEDGKKYVGNDGGGTNAPSFTFSSHSYTGASQTSGGAGTYGSNEIAGSFGFANNHPGNNVCSRGGWNGGGNGADNWAAGGAGGGWWGGFCSWPTSTGGSGYVSHPNLSNTTITSGNEIMPNPSNLTTTMIGNDGNGVAIISWAINAITYTGPTVINVSSVNHVMWSYTSSTSNVNSSSFTYTVISDANSCISNNNGGTLTLSGNRGSVQVKISETGSEELTVTLSIIVTPTLNNYNSGVTNITKFYNDINTSFNVTSPTSTTPNVGTPAYSYSVAYATNGPPSTPITATVSSSSSSGATILINDTGQCFIRVTKAQDLPNFLDVAVSNIALTVRPGYIVGPNVDLSGAVIQNYDLNGVNFSSCNLTNARIINCLLANAIFTGANFTNATFTYNTITSTTNLSSANFTGLISNNNDGNTTLISSTWKIQGGKIVESGTVYFSLSFVLASPSFALPSGTGLSTSTPSGDGHYRMDEGNLYINGKVESALSANLSTNFIVRSTNTRYALVEVGPNAKYTFELINSTTSTGYSGTNTMYIRGIKTATNTVTRLRNISRTQTFSVSYQILSAVVPLPYQVSGSYLFGPNMSLAGTYFDNTINPKPVLTDASFINLSLSNSSTINASNLFVATGIGSSNTLAYSLDGITWIGSGKSIFETQGLGVAYSSIYGQWVAVGQGTAHTIAYSSDGINWIGAGKTIFSTVGYGVAYNPDVSMWVAVGQGTNSIAYSSDATNWTGAGTSIFTSSGRAVAYSSDQERWVAVGNGTNRIAYSNDGISWTGVGTSVFTSNGFGVAYSSALSRWVAVGNGTNTIAYSSDGISWTGIGMSIFSTTGFGVAYSESALKWVAVGSGTNTVAYSTNGINWTGISVSGFTSGVSIGYNSGLSLWVAGGSGSNPVIYSSNGESWTASTSGTSVFSGGSQIVLGIGSSEASGTSGSSSYGTSSNTNTNTTLQGWTLTRTKLTNGRFYGVCFSDCNCNATDFSGSDLENASFKITYTSKQVALTNIATLQNAKFTNCTSINNLTITGYDNDSTTPLNQMDVSGLDFSGSNVRYITTYFLNRTGGGPINMLSEPLGRDLKRYGYRMLTDSLIGRFLAGPGMCLKELSLGNVDFSGTNLSNVDISGTNLTTATLYGISMRAGNKTYYSNSTILPTGYRIVKPKVTSVSNPAYIVGRGIDLSGVDARGLNFEFSDIRVMNFTNALFSGVTSGNMISSTDQPTLFPTSAYNVANGYFIGPFVDLSGANLSSSTLTNYNLTGANLTNAVLVGATSGGISTTATVDNVQYTQQPTMPTGYGLTRGYIVGPSMNLINVDLSGFDFTNVNLSGTNFSGSSLKYVISGNTTSSGTTILPDASYAFLSGFIVGPQVNLSSKNVSGVKFSTVTAGGFTLSGSLFVGANLTSADFSGVILDGIDFTNANFTRTSSRNIPQPTVFPIFTAGQNAGYTIRSGYIIGANVDMSFTNLTGIDISNTVLTGANFTGATLNGVKSGGGGITVLSTSQPTLPPKYKVLGGFLHGPNVDLSGANLSNLTFDTVSNAINWSSANLTNARFTNVKSGWIEIDSDFSGPILSPPYIYNRRVASNPSGGFIIGPGVNLSSANFTNFDLRNVLDVANVNFTGATFTNVKTSGTIATPTAGNFPTFSAGSGYVLYRGFIIGPNVNMSGTNLSTFVFGTNAIAVAQGSTAALSGVNFSYANLTSANLLGSTVNGTNFTGSNFLRTRTGGLSYTNIIPTLPNSVIQPIFDETNWYSIMVPDIPSGSTTTGSGPLVQSNLVNGTLSAYGKWSYSSVPFASYSALYFSEEIYWDPATGYGAGDEYYITFGAQSSTFEQGIVIKFMFLPGYSNNGFSGVGIYLLKDGLAVAKSTTLPNGAGPRQWFTVSVTYTRSITNTWQVNIDGVSGLTYSDSNALTWAASAGNWFIVGATSGNSLRMSLFVRRLYMASTIASNYKYVNITASGGYIIGPGVDLTQTNLQGADFTNVNFNNVLMSGANISNAVSENISYDASSALPTGYIFITNNAISSFIMGPNLNFTSKTLNGSAIRNVDLTGTVFTNTQLIRVKSSGLTFNTSSPPLFTVGSGYKVKSGFLIGPSVDLSGENMTGADLSGENLTSASFINADMSGVNLFNSTLSFSTFTGASFFNIRSGGRMNFVSPPLLPSPSYKLVSNGYNEAVANSGFQRYIVGPNANCRGADFSGAFFDRVDLSNVDFSGANFTYVSSGIMRNQPILSSLPSGFGLVSGVNTQDIQSQDPSYNNALYFIGPYANLSNAFLKNAEMKNVNITGVDFTGADFNGLSTSGLIGTPQTLPSTSYFIRGGYIFGPTVNLSGGIFTGLDISNSILTGANFTNSNFTNVNLNGCNILNAKFAGSTMTGAKTAQILYQGYDYGDNLSGQDPSLPTSYRYVYNSNTSVGYIIGPYVDISGSDLRGSDLAYTNLTGINLFGADIRNVRSGNITISGGVQPTFTPNSGYKVLSGYIIGPYVDLRGIDFTNQDFSGTNLTGTIFTNSIFVNIKSGNIVASPVLPVFPDTTFTLRNGYIFGPNVDLSFSDLSGMDLSGLTLTNARMQNTNFTNVRSGGIIGTSAFMRTNYIIRNGKAANDGYIIGDSVDLSGATLTVANLANAYLTNANITNVTFSNATLLNGVKSGGNLRYNAKTLSTMPTNYTIRGTYIVGPRVDLSGANLTSLDLSNTVLTGVNMSNATFTNMRSGGIQMLTAAPITFSSAASYGSEFGYKYLNGYIVGPGVDLTGSNFSGITFSSVDLSGVKLSGSNLSSIRSLNVAGIPASLPSGYKVTARYIIGPGLDMSGYNFTNGDFSGADITGSILINANFTNTSSGNVTGSAQTRFTTTVEPVNIKYQLSNGYIVGPKVNLSNGDLSGVNVSGINLTNATLFNTKTGKVIFNDQTVVPNSNYKIIASYIIGPNVNLTGVDFSGVDLRYTNLTNVNFAGANLFNVRSGFISGTPQQLPTFYSFIGGFIIGPNTDLSGADLSGGNLANVSIQNADLTNANFYNVSSGGIQGTPRAPLNVPYVVTPNGYIVGPNVNLNNAVMPNIDLRGLTLTNAVMTNMDFTNTKFGNNIGVPRVLSPPYIHVQTTLSGGFIVGPLVDISYGNFSYANLATADLTGAKLSNATFFQTKSGRMATSPGIPASLPAGYSILSTTSSGGYLIGPNVDLNDANFSGESTVLAGLNLTNALMDRVRFDGAKMGGGRLIGPPNTINPLYRFIQSSASGGYIIGPNIDLSGANFSNTDISFVYVDGIQFTNTNFTNTKSGRLLVRAPDAGTLESPVQPTVFSPTTYRLIFSGVSGGYIIGPNVNLSDANFTDTDISATFLTGVNMSNARLDNMRSGLLTVSTPGVPPTLPPSYKYVVSSASGGYIIGPNQNLTQANLTGADLSFCNFSGCNTLQTIFPSVPTSLYFTRSGGIPNTSVPAFLPSPYKFITNAASGGYIVGPFSDLSGANLESSILTNTDISGANFTNARLRFARSGEIPNTSVPAVLPSPYKFITNAASGGYIIGPFSDLSGANLESSVLTDTDISGANFTNARLRFTRSGGIPNTSVPAVLPSPYKFITNAVSGGYIVGPFSDLSGANLESSVLTGTDISGTNFTNARLRFTQSGGIPNTSVPAVLPSPYKFITNAASGGYIVGPFSDLSGANLESSILTDTDISGANFTNVRLRFTRSGGIPNASIPAVLPSPYKFITNTASGGYIVGPFSDLSGANLESSILTDTDISGANFTNARLRFARSGGIPNTSVPAVLPSPYKFITNAASGGYIVGPFSDLSGANMESSILTNTDISGANFTNARLRFAKSGGIPNASVPAVLPSPYKFVTNVASGGYIVGPFSDLSGANFEASILTDTDVSSANLTNARLINVKTGLLAQGAPASLPPTYTFIRSAVTASGGYIVGTGVDLSGAVLTGTDLSGTVFTDTNIQNARLGITNLVNVRSGGVRGVPATLTTGYAVVNDNSSGAYIVGNRVDLSGANLTNCVLIGLDITGANMLGANMINAKTGPNLLGPPAVFPSPNYNYVVSSASGGFLIGPGVDISGANLSNSNLTNYDFRGANLTGVDLSGCILTNVKSGQTTGPPKALPPSYVFMTDNSFGAFLIGPNVDLSGANLTNCQFSGLNITGASFTNAIMRNVKSGGGMIGPPASLPSRYRYVYDGSAGDNTAGYFIGPGVDLSGARLRNLSDLSNSVYNLDGAHLTDANITNANFNGSSMKNVKSGGIVGLPQSLPVNFTLVFSASGGYFIGPESDLQNANLNDVSLTGMNITQADMSGATFINTRTGGLIGPPRTLTGGYYFVQRPGTGGGTGVASDAYILGPGVNLSAANLSGADLTNFDMSGANLSNVTFTNTTLTNANIFNANLSGINPGTPIENNFTVKQNLQLLKNRNNRSIQRIRLTDCSAGDIDVVDAIPRVSYDPCYNRIYDYIRPLPTSVLIPDNSGNSNLSRLSPSGRVFYIPSGPGESFYVDSSATLTTLLPTPIPGNTQTTQYYHDVSGRRIVETATGNTIRSVLVNGKVFLVFGASMLGISIIDVYRALGFPAVFEVYSYYGTRNLTLPEKVSQVNTITGNGNVSLNWVPSFSDGKPRLGYVVEYTDTEPVAQLYVPWVIYSDRYPLTNVTITGLTNGKTYYFRVAAVNVIGTGAYSDIVTCIPGTRPDDVSTLFITSDASLTAFVAEWSDPYNQGYPIQTYTLRYRPALTLDPWIYAVINTDNPLLVRTVQGTKSVRSSYPLTTSANSGLVPSLPPPAVQNLYQIQISATNILGTNEFANPAPVTNTTLLDTDSMTVLAPNVVFSRIGTLPQKVSMSSIIPTIIPDLGGKKVKLSWLVPTPYSYVPYAYAIKYTLLTDVSGVLVPPPANIPDASWNVISSSSFTVSYDEIRTAAEAGANTAVMTIISGLTNGQRYSFRIAALNAAGRGAYSDAIPASIIPGSVPSILNVATEIAYTINTSTGGVINVYWVPPNKNGYTVTSYRVRRRLNLQGDADWVTTEIAVPPGVTDTQPYRTLTTSGLVNGTVYEYQVASKNQLGWSEYSETLYAVPRKVPDPILNVSANILNQGLKVNWNTAGVNDGGYPVTSYRVQYLPVTVSTPSDAWRSIDVDGIYSSTVEISGLVNGITHRIRVLQFNAIGSSVPELSGITEAVPGVISLPPTGLFITVGNTRLTLFWTAPTSTGTNDVSYYFVQYKKASDSDNLYDYVKNPGQTTPKQYTNANVSLVPNAPGYDAFFAIVEGLANGTNYSVRVAAVTQVGLGEWSIPLEGIPGTVPSKVT